MNINSFCIDKAELRTVFHLKITRRTLFETNVSTVSFLPVEYNEKKGAHKVKGKFDKLHAQKIEGFVGA